MKILAVDPGTSRCGLATCDPLGIIASPAGIIEVKDGRELPVAIAARAREMEAELILIGLPLNADGSVGPRAKAAERLAEAVRAVTDIPVELFDERYTSFEAAEIISSKKRRPRHDDAVAAAVLLRRYLDILGGEKGDRHSR